MLPTWPLPLFRATRQQHIIPRLGRAALPNTYQHFTLPTKGKDQRVRVTRRTPSSCADLDNSADKASAGSRQKAPDRNPSSSIATHIGMDCRPRRYFAHQITACVIGLPSHSPGRQMQSTWPGGWRRQRTLERRKWSLGNALIGSPYAKRWFMPAASSDRNR